MRLCFGGKDICEDIQIVMTVAGRANVLVWYATCVTCGVHGDEYDYFIMCVDFWRFIGAVLSIP